MIKRIVKMSFRPEHVNDFKKIFAESQHLIAGFEGCTHLELWQDIADHSTFFTYSTWQAESDLDRYRHSELFKSVWGKTKVLFRDKPQAWSVDQLF
jgi:(4S)-4-hydroxy-5-phosphonooxypentane-2,3-dione isomerase